MTVALSKNTDNEMIRILIRVGVYGRVSANGELLAISRPVWQSEMTPRIVLVSNSVAKFVKLVPRLEVVSVAPGDDRSTTACTATDPLKALRW
jgi:hypothetical protein